MVTTSEFDDVKARLDGAFTLLIMHEDRPGEVVGARHISPLVIGLGDGENFLGSDVAAFVEYTRRAVEIGDDQIVTIRPDSVDVTDFDGKPVKRFDDAVRLLHADENRPVSLTFVRGEITDSKAVGREKMAVLLETSHQKLVDGVIVPLDFTEAEMREKMKSLSLDRFADRAFPSHYPTDEKVYYGGFEVLTLKSPAQVVVLGIEDGPASRSGVHWGDTIVAVNGVDPRGKTAAELEKLFSSDKPDRMTLKIDRSGVAKTYVFDMEQAAKVLRDNGSRLVHNVPMPIGVPEKYLSCFF